MAIVKMKRLRAIAMSSQRDELLRELQKLGCVELTSQDWAQEDPETAGLVSADHGPVAEAQAEKQMFRKAIDLLDRFAPRKTPLLSPKPEIGAGALLDDPKAAEARAQAGALAEKSEELKALDADEVREKLRVETLQPWKGCELPLDHPGTKSVALSFGALPKNADYPALCAAMDAEVGAAELFEVSSDEAARYIYAVYLRSESENALRLLREYGFTVPAFGEVHGRAAENIADAQRKLADIASRRAAVEGEIAGAAQYRDSLLLGYDRAGAGVDRAEAAGKLLKTQSTVLLEGWARADRERELTALLQKLDCAYEFTEPAEEEYGAVPVELKNNKLTDGLNMVTNMYSLPRYGTLDPNPLMAPFFIIFYGIMMADMGYGVIMMLAGALILLKKKPKRGFMKYFGELMVEGGVTTFIFGALTGGLFGDAPLQLARMFNPNTTFEGLPSLFDPLNDTIYVLVGAMILGFIQLNAGMVISFVQKVRRGEVLDGVFYEVALWIIFIGAALMFFTGSPIVLIIGAVMLFGGAMRGKKGFGKFTAVFSTLYNELTGWFGDILSYSRLMALMLAGSVIASVFNTLGALPGNIIVFIIIFIIGHALNFGLNLLGCYVHDLRLQCLEYFGKFYVDGGRPFEPLGMRNTKDADVTEK